MLSPVEAALFNAKRAAKRMFERIQFDPAAKAQYDALPDEVKQALRERAKGPRFQLRDERDDEKKPPFASGKFTEPTVLEKIEDELWELPE